MSLRNPLERLVGGAATTLAHRQHHGSHHAPRLWMSRPDGSPERADCKKCQLAGSALPASAIRLNGCTCAAEWHERLNTSSDIDSNLPPFDAGPRGHSSGETDRPKPLQKGAEARFYAFRVHPKSSSAARAIARGDQRAPRSLCKGACSIRANFPQTQRPQGATRCRNGFPP